MQIRLTVLGPPNGGRAPQCDVLVTAPAGTPLAAVTSGLAAAVGGPEGPVVVYAGRERVDGKGAAPGLLGEPPLVDGAVLTLQSPAEPEPSAAGDAARLHVVAGPDAGGVHLLHGGRISIGRSAEADVPLDDPDVSRVHCAITVGPDGRVTVADLNSTNGTTLDGSPVTDQSLRFSPGALLRIGESALRLALPSDEPPLPTVADGEGQLRVVPTGAGAGAGAGIPGPVGGTVRGAGSAGGFLSGPDGPGGPGGPESGGPAPGGVPSAEGRVPPARRGGSSGMAGGAFAPDGGPSTGPMGAAGPAGPSGPAPSASGSAAYGVTDASSAPYGSTPAAPDGFGHAPYDGSAASYDNSAASPYDSPYGPTATPYDDGDAAPHEAPAGPGRAAEPPPLSDPDVPDAPDRALAWTPARGTTVPRQVRRRGGIGAWARRLTGGRGGEGQAADGDAPVPRVAAAEPPVPEVWPDPAALLLTALGPGPRLWERGPEHPEALAVRLGTADRSRPDGAGLLPSVPVTVGLREAGALGLAGPRERLLGLARAVLAQLAALHSPTDLEIVLLSLDRGRPVQERTAEWSWLGWLPHLRPGHGQDCRLLLAYDREQAAARTGELLRRLDGYDSHGSYDDHTTNLRGGYAGPRTVVVVDGDPGSAGLREATVRLVAQGPGAGIHLVCLAETPPASPASPVAATYEAACVASPAFRACGAVALLSGDVATALRLLRTSQGQPVGHGTVAAVDAVSAAWATRFARALAPLRPDEPVGTGGRTARVAVPLPQAARLLDELGLARATPASLMARWAAAADDKDAVGGRAHAVLGAGPRGPVCADLVAAGPHLLAEGPAGSGKTELLRSLAAGLAAAERPDRLAFILVDGAGPERGEGLRVCTDLPHVTEHLAANDPVRMREFAQALAAELKRRAELLGRLGFAEWHTQREVSGRMVTQRTRSGSGAGAGQRPSASGQLPVPGQAGEPSSGDLDSPSSSTLKLRPGGAGAGAGGDARRPEPGAPLPRLVVVVDDVDALVAPALGAPGRPSAGSVVRALEAVARDGERLGVHLVAATGRPERTAETELARRATLRVTLDAPSAAPEDPAPGRGWLHSDSADGGASTPFQAGRVTGRIPRTSTLRPTAVPLEWERMGDPPARRPVRELGNGPTDLALLASALERAARSVGASSS
ncbi:FtsK/SpoIIIE domain-containing protein [Streptomyces sp. NPDC002851]